MFDMNVYTIQSRCAKLENQTFKITDYSNIAE